MAVRNTHRRMNGQQTQMTSAVAITASPIRDVFPTIVIDDNVVPEAEPFSDHLSREIDKPESESRSEHDDRDNREPEQAERYEEPREADGRDDLDRKVDETPDREQVATSTDESETETKASDGSGKEEGKAEDNPDRKATANDNTTNNKQAQENGGETTDALATEEVVDPTAIAGAATDPKTTGTAKAETVLAATPAANQAKLAVDPAVNEAAARDALPRVRKGNSRSQVNSLADIAAQGGQSKATASSPTAAAHVAANAGEKAGQQLAANPNLGQQAQLAKGGEQIQFTGHLQANATAAPTAQATQQAMPQQTMGDPLAGDTVEFDSKPTGQISQANSSAAASKTVQAQSARPAALANQASVQVAFELGRAAHQGLNRLSMHLHPAELGRVDVRIEVASDGRAMAHVVVDRPETLDALQRDARSLERALSDAGLQTDSGSLNFSLRQDPGDSQDTASGSQGSGSGSGDLAADDAVAVDAAELPQIVSDRALDIRV